MEHDARLDAETRLLHMAYRRIPLNASLTGAAALGVALLGSRALIPADVVASWVASLLVVNVLGGYLLWGLYRRRPPEAPARGRWKALFILQSTVSGLTWGFGPTFTMSVVPGPAPALFAAVLLAVNGIALATMIEVLPAMRGFLVAGLLPPALAAWASGGTHAELTAVILGGGLVCMLAVGANPHRSMRASVETELRMRDILDTSLDGIVEANAEGRITDWNLGAERVFAWTKSEMMGSPLDAIIPERKRARFGSEIERYLTSGSSFIVKRRLETSALRRNGEEFPIDLAIIPRGVGRNQLFSFFIADISERKAQEDRIARAKEAAERANRAKSEFLSSMSHELRTPMNAVLGFAQVLEHDDGLTDPQRDDVRAILRAGRHLLDLIGEILDLSQIESGKLQVTRERMAIDPAVRDAMRFIEPIAESKQIRVEYTPGPELTAVADPRRFRQVMLNLLSNAVKYNRARGVVRISVESVVAPPEERIEASARPKDRVRVSVEDSGLGIAAERFGELFEPFNRLEAGRGALEGTGIGLTITRRLVELMGGTVDLRSEPGVGTTFFVELPAAEPVVDEPHRARFPGSDASNADPPRDAARYRVVYVDDNQINLDIVAGLLAKRGDVVVRTATDGARGLALLREEKPDVLFVDLRMPDIDGYQVLEQVRADPSLRSMPVVALSADAMPHDVERGLRAGFDDYVVKPVDRARLFAVLDGIVARTDDRSRERRS